MLIPSLVVMLLLVSLAPAGSRHPPGYRLIDQLAHSWAAVSPARSGFYLGLTVSGGALWWLFGAEGLHLFAFTAPELLVWMAALDASIGLEVLLLATMGAAGRLRQQVWSAPALALRTWTTMVRGRFETPASVGRGLHRRPARLREWFASLYRFIRTGRSARERPPHPAASDRPRSAARNPAGAQCLVILRRRHDEARAPAGSSRIAILGRAGLFLVFAGALGAATAPGPGASERGCEAVSGTVLSISGRIDDALAACVAERLSASTSEIILNTEGGSAEAAMDIAERLEGRRLTMRVRRQCNSSCANYLLPLAGRLIVEADALIILHGSIDPALVSRAETTEERDRLARTAERQRAFAVRNSVHPGWLLYRTNDPVKVAALDGDWVGAGQARAFIVEERMARSCLTGVQIEPFQQALERGPLRPGRAERLHRRGYARSGTVACNAMGWPDFPASQG